MHMVVSVEKWAGKRKAKSFCMCAVHDTSVEIFCYDMSLCVQLETRLTLNDG